MSQWVTDKLSWNTYWWLCKVPLGFLWPGLISTGCAASRARQMIWLILTRSTCISKKPRKRVQQKMADRVHTRQSHFVGVDWIFCIIPVGLDPKVRPLPFTGAMPRDSFFRRSISAFTIPPRPIALDLGRRAFEEVISLTSSDELNFLAALLCPWMNVDPDATGILQWSSLSSSDDRSIMSSIGTFDEVVWSRLLKSNSCSNPFQELLNPSLLLKSASSSDLSNASRLSASVSPTGSNSGSDSSSSFNASDDPEISESDGTGSTQKVWGWQPEIG